MNSQLLRAMQIGCAAFTCLLVSSSASAAVFRNQFLEFETPQQWSCSLDGAEYTCQDTRPAHTRDSMIVFAAKLKGAQDSLQIYREYLKQSKTWRDPKGRSITSTVLSVNDATILGHPWVDAIQDESEVAAFRTRYLATVKDDISVLVTFSVRKDKYADIAPDLNAMLNSLRVKARPGSTTATEQDAGAKDVGAKDAGATIATVDGGGVPPRPPAPGRPPAAGSASSCKCTFTANSLDDRTPAGLVALVLGIVATRRSKKWGSRRLAAKQPVDRAR